MGELIRKGDIGQTWSSRIEAAKKAYLGWETEKKSAQSQIEKLKASAKAYGRNLPTSLSFTRGQLQGRYTQLGRKKVSFGTGIKRLQYARKASRQLMLQKEKALALGEQSRQQLESESQRISKLTNPYAKEASKYYKIKGR